MKNVVIFFCCFFANFLFGQNECGIQFTTQRVGACCAWNLQVANLPPGVNGVAFDIDYENACDTFIWAQLTQLNPTQASIQLLDCFSKTISVLNILVFTNTGPNCQLTRTSIDLDCGGNIPDCDPTHSFLENMSFEVSYSEFGFSPCTELGNHVGLALNFNFPNLCWNNCQGLLPQATVCWTDGCVDYVRTFTNLNNCNIINPVLVGSQYTVSVSSGGNCCSAPYTGSRTLTAQYNEPCPLTNACNQLCPHEGPFGLNEGVLECVACNPPIGAPNVSVTYDGQAGNLYNFSGSVSPASQDCDILSLEWICWKWNPYLGYREPIPCTPGSSIMQVSVDTDPYCNNDVVGACLIVKDNCNCNSDGLACENGPTIVKDPCEFDVVFNGVGISQPGDPSPYYFSLQPGSCSEVTWTVTCGNYDVPFTEVEEGGIIVYPETCLYLTVCAQVPGCDPKCITINVQFPPQAFNGEAKALNWSDVSIHSRSNLIDEELQGSFSVTPNPANDQVMVTLGDKENSIEALTIYNVNGKLMRQLHELGSYQTQLDVSTYTTGLYMIEIIDQKGNRSIKKLIVE